MSEQQTMSCVPITPTLVPLDQRIQTLPKHFGAGRLMQVFENRVYDTMDAQAAGYKGGFWEFIELSNGGFYMRPPAGPLAGKWMLDCESNGYQGELSADAIGIVMCLHAYSHLSFEFPTQVLAEKFHALREYAMDHPEANEIIQAID
jgi:hypothetical protein